jgi:hypothetical protein
VASNPRFVAPSIGRSRLDDSGLPPELPDRYQGLVEPPARERSTPAPARDELPLGAPRVIQSLTPGADESHENTARSGQRMHQLVDGDSLARLAQSYWGDASLAGELLAANRDVLGSGELLPVGVTIRIPPRPAPATPSAAPVNDGGAAPIRQPR